MKKYDVIFIALARWDGPYSSTAYSIAKEWAKTHRVFYIENPHTWKDYYTNKHKATFKSKKKALLKGQEIFNENHDDHLVTVTPRLIFPINWLPSGFIYNMLNGFNNITLQKAIDDTIETYEIKDFIVFNSFNPFYNVASKLKKRPILSIYQSVDRIENSDYVRKHGGKLESEYIKQADFTLTTSVGLKKSLSNLSEDIHVVPNAANFSLFSRAFYENLPKPADFPTGSVPVICYTGNICHRINYNLLIKIAKSHSDKHLLMVGPINTANSLLEKLKAFPNVTFTGAKKLDELPAYLKYSQCAIIPFLINGLTNGIYPLKINEYLATGTPVVSTAFSEDIISFKEVALVTEDEDEFVKLITTAIAHSQSGRENRVKIAEGNTWPDRVNQIKELIEKYYEKEKV